MPPSVSKKRKRDGSPPATPPPAGGSSKEEPATPKSSGGAWAAEEDGVVIEELLKQFKPNWNALQEAVNKRGGNDRTPKAIRMRWEKHLRKKIAALGGL